MISNRFDMQTDRLNIPVICRQPPTLTDRSRTVDRPAGRWSRSFPKALLIGLLLFAVPASTAAFHDGGVASCKGCHVMHQGASGTLLAGALLDGGSPSDVCLSCHANDAGAVLGPDPLAPPPERGGGNFVFLLEDNLNDAVDGASNPIVGDAAGHNLVAPGHGLFADSRHAVAPGGSFPASQLGCTSCHDPHGRNTFRMLWSDGPIQGGTYTFTYSAPRGEGIPLNGPAESRTHHTAYQAGFNDWCRNCHGVYHDDVGDPLAFEHPTDEILSADEITQYNNYDGDPPPGLLAPVIGLFATAYLPEVPLEDPGATVSGQSGATALSKVMCLSCHRAHATSGPHAGRWDFNVTTLDADGTVSFSYPIPNPYGPSQGTLCTKCHEGGPPAPDSFSGRFRQP